MASVATTSVEVMLHEMDEALAFEIKVQESTNKSGRHIAVNGKPVEEKNDLLHLYEFSLEDPWETQDDAPIKVLINTNQIVRATIVRSNGLTITIGTKEALPPEALQQITLIDDSIELLKRLREMLQKNQESPAKLGSKAFGSELFRAGKVTLPPAPLFNKCNEPQKRAISTALGSEVAYIIGPPGTGKTFTLALIALQYILTNRSVLIVSNTNIAVDNAIIGIAKLQHDAGASLTQRLKEGKIIRYGASRNNDLTKPEYADIYLPAIIKRKSVDLTRQLEERQAILKQEETFHSNQLKPLELERTKWATQREKIIEQLKLAKQELHRLQTVENERKATLTAQMNQRTRERQEVNQYFSENEQILATKHGEYVRNVSEIEKLVAQRYNLSEQLAAAQQMNKIARMFKGIDLDSLSTRLSEVSYRIWQIEENQKSIQAALNAAYSERATYENQLSTIQAELVYIDHLLRTPTSETAKIAELQAETQQLERQFTEADTALKTIKRRIEEGKQAYQHTTANLREQITDVEEQLRAVETTVVAQAQVVATTLSKTYMSLALNQRPFDVVIVDEISMASLPSVFIAASRATNAFIAIGDPQQLAPIATAKDDHPLVNTWLATDLFTYRGITLENSIYGFENSVLLQYQFRMHPEISKIAREHVYRRHLEDSPNLRVEEIPIQPLPEKRLILCDTSDASPQAIRPQWGSRYNIYHALCAIALARQVLLSLPDNSSNNTEQERIGIVTPYKRQAKILQQLIRDAGIERWVRAGTVHKFQGLEFDVVIFDTVESPTNPPTSPREDFIAGGERTNAQRLVNVAITRARHKLIVVANAAHIKSACNSENNSFAFPANSTLRLAIQEAEQSSRLNSLEVVRLPFEVQEETFKPRSNFFDEILKRFEELDYMHFDEHTFYPQLIDDIRSAQSQVIIFSPFLSLKRVDSIKPVLFEKCRAGKEVIVATSGKDDPTYPDIIADLKQGGIKHLTLNGEHEKFAFIDKSIAYVGSLNALSQIGTIEYMLRIKSRSFVKSLWDFLDVGKATQAPTSLGQPITISIKELPRDLKCKKCNKSMQIRKGRFGYFYGCEGYYLRPRCGYTEDITEEHLISIQEISNVKCEKCGGPTTLSVYRKDAWLICTAPNPCNYGYHIDFIDDMPKRNYIYQNRRPY